LTALLGLGVVIVLSAPLLFIRRRKPEKAVQATAKARRSEPRRLVDPVAGIEVVEGQLARAPSSAQTIAPNFERTATVDSRAGMAAAPRPLVINIGPTDSVDLDVGLPLKEERVDWFGERAATAMAANPALTDVTTEVAATAQKAELDSTANVPQQTRATRKAELGEPATADEQHTLTIVELDLLRQDYEAEHTLTQASSEALRDALADLRATQAAQAASAETATFEMPQQPQAETIETQPTQRLRSR
jgi:hypothetical protein